ncbi:MAG: ligase-associated DNA damage response DEXH box helicase [Lautropia sp.]
MTGRRSAALQAAEGWFRVRGWWIFPFQRAVWRACLDGRSGLLHASTGAGKTYAVWFAALLRTLCCGSTAGPPGIRVIWITPMRALAADTARSLLEPVATLLPTWEVGVRTGDTTAAQRARQAGRLPQALVTTPESLSLLLSRADTQARLQTLDMVIVDEWHELMGNKRGVQTQLALARLRGWNPRLVVWGLSATLGNLAQAQDALLGVGQGDLVEAKLRKTVRFDTLLPVNPSRFPWSGHLGVQMLQPVIREIDAHASTLVFTNTRSQAELWYQHLLDARPDWAGIVALHHGSLDRSVREWVEIALKEGRLKAVVCTSSLDLGVDFLPVERVLQIGSAKGVARLLQRAGRSGHAPGRPSRITLVPTQTLEILEAAAARRSLSDRRIEQRPVPHKPLDVLVQHLVTIALGSGFRPEQLLCEVRSSYSYRDLGDEEWQWALDFVSRGGRSLTVYPQFRRVVADPDGVYRVPDAALARRHRMSIGTIVSDADIRLQFLSGGRIGTVEESFVARMRKGDHFLFGGRVLEFVRVHDMVAYVRRGSRSHSAVARWQGGRMPLSSELAHAVLDRLQEADLGRFEGEEMRAIRPLLDLQRRWSSLPTARRLVAETLSSREGCHLFLYPFEGRSVHVGLASLLAYRVARLAPATFSIAVNDYGLELLSAAPVDWATLLAESAERLFSGEAVLEDTLASLNAGELAQRRFREIARIAGLVSPGYPGQPKSNRQVQASSSLYFEVFRRHDQHNLLLEQARREVLKQELEIGQLRLALAALRGRSLAHVAIARPTPLAFPLMVERMREKLSTEKLSDRVARMVRQLEAAAAP